MEEEINNNCKITKQEKYETPKGDAFIIKFLEVQGKTMKETEKAFDKRWEKKNQN